MKDLTLPTTGDPLFDHRNAGPIDAAASAISGRLKPKKAQLAST